MGKDKEHVVLNLNYSYDLLFFPLMEIVCVVSKLQSNISRANYLNSLIFCILYLFT